ncbi:TPA: hypothetical protein ACK0G9_003087 [Proteus mirabilis]|uniref:hypothetical protein n=1 Tax=Proteus mirabilis TaxID=584 RepID=UPI0016260999|nr:hypothetical protein [Proteus mirabilis]MBB6687625.1 hypothetical protein [Proteus mirabilis]
MKHWKLYIVIVMVGIVAGGYVVKGIQDIITQRDKLLAENKQLTKENESYSKLLSDQVFQFNRFNQISATASRYGITTDANSEKRIIEYRKILQKEPTCDLYIPDDIANRLYNYTEGLRTREMHPDTRSINSTNDSSTTSYKMTYCQAVFWIDPLITTIDKGNERFRAIREIESDRSNSKLH